MAQNPFETSRKPLPSGTHPPNGNTYYDDAFESAIRAMKQAVPPENWIRVESDLQEGCETKIKKVGFEGAIAWLKIQEYDFQRKAEEVRSMQSVKHITRIASKIAKRVLVYIIAED